MNLTGKKVTALLLAACLLLGLTACKKSGGEDANLLSGTIYVPTFAGINADAEYIYSGCASGDSFYFVGQVRGEEHEETETWTDENGEVQTNTYTWYDWGTAIFHVPLEGGDAVKLENFHMTELPEGTEGNVNIDGGMWVDNEGSLWVMESIWIYNFDLPEDFDEENESRWEYYTGEERTTVMHKLDDTGAEIDSVDLTDLTEKAEMEWISNTSFDSDGNIYTTNGNDKLAVLDKDLNLLFTLEGENLWDTMIQLSDGSMGILNSYWDEERQVGGNRLRTVDLENQDWGPSYELSQYAYEIYPGGGDYLFYYRNNTSIYGLKTDTGEGEKVFSWMSSDIDPNSVSFFTFLADGRIAAMTRSWSEGGEKYNYESAILTPTDASTLPQKRVLTFACMGLGYDMRNRILEFNKKNTDVRIEVSDYNEYNTGEDTSAGLTKLNTEVLAGRVPDILVASNDMPISQYGARGLLEDLWPFIENDEGIGGREGVMENVLKAAEQNGKLYRVFDQFDIRTVVGASRVVGERTSWTLADLKAALATMPEGCSIFGVSDTQEQMLRTIMYCNMDSFVDWSTGECYFNGDSFKALLEFCASFPAEFDWDNVDWDNWEDEDQRIMSGKQMLQTAYIDNFTGIQGYQAIFGGDVSFVGYPMEDGSIGSSFQIVTSGLAMSTACKDKDSAWSFIRQLLLSKVEEDGDSSSGAVMNARALASSSMAPVSTVSGHYFYDFPVNKKDFETFLNDSLTIEYITDENGEVVIYEETGEPAMAAKDSYYIRINSETGESEWHDIYAAEQKDVDQIMDLYNSITTLYYYDENIFNIVYENTGAYFAGDRTLEDTANLIQSAVKLYVGEQS